MVTFLFRLMLAGAFVLLVLLSVMTYPSAETVFVVIAALLVLSGMTLTLD
jgi:hypothetical protein